jgi:hypothetical protein
VPNVEDHDLAGLEEERTRLHEELVGVGDFRQGSVYSVHRPCGKPHCACAEPGHPGHGPLHLMSKSVAGKTVTKSVSATALEKVQQEVGNYKRFRSLVDEIVDVNEQICDERPVPSTGTAKAVEDGQKRGSKKPSRRRSRPK